MQRLEAQHLVSYMIIFFSRDKRPLHLSTTTTTKPRKHFLKPPQNYNEPTAVETSSPQPQPIVHQFKRSPEFRGQNVVGLNIFSVFFWYYVKFLSFYFDPLLWHKATLQVKCNSNTLKTVYKNEYIFIFVTLFNNF